MRKQTRPLLYTLQGKSGNVSFSIEPAVVQRTSDNGSPYKLKPTFRNKLVTFVTFTSLFNIRFSQC